MDYIHNVTNETFWFILEHVVHRLQPEVENDRKYIEHLLRKFSDC